MPATETDTTSRLAWAMRRYAWLFPVAVIGFLALSAALLVPRLDTRTYEARALIVASDLMVSSDQLPRFAQAVFSSGTVPESIVEELGLDMQPSALVPEYAEIEPLENTVAVYVLGRANDPEVAAAIANQGAEALVPELNRAGPGLGAFTLQAQARPPENPVGLAALPAAMLVGLIGGVTFAAGTIGLLLVTRRPVVTAGQAQTATGLPTIQTVSIPRRKRSGVRNAPGLAALAKRLYPNRVERVAFVSPGKSASAGGDLAMLLARYLAGWAPVTLVSPRSDLDGGPGVTRRPTLPRHEDPSVALVIDAPAVQDVDILQLLPADAKTVLVVEEGVGAKALLAAMEPFDEIEGLVFLRRHRTRRSAVSSDAATGPGPRNQGLNGGTRSSAASQPAVNDRRPSAARRDQSEAAGTTGSP